MPPAPTDLKLSTLITSTEVLLSSEVIQRLVDRDGYEYDAAKQALSRAMARETVIWRSEKLLLEGQECVYAHHSYVGKEQFLADLSEKLTLSRPGISRIIPALKKNTFLLRAEAEKLLAFSCLDGPTSRTSTYKKDLAALQEIKAGEITDEGSDLERIAIPAVDKNLRASPALALSRQGDLKTQTQLTKIVIEHFKKQSIISWDGHELPKSEDKNALFNGFAFSASAYSYLDPLLNWQPKNKDDQTPAPPKPPKPTPVLLDVYARTCMTYDIQGFLHRIKRAKSLKNGADKTSKLKVLGVIAAYDFDKDAWNLAKNSNLLVINLTEFFGEFAISTIKRFSTINTSLSANGGNIDLDGIAADLVELRNNPYVADFRGLALEIWAALYLSTMNWEGVENGLLVQHGEGKKREVDAVGTLHKQTSAFMIECKANLDGKRLDPDYVSKFFQETVPAYIKHQNKINGIVPSGFGPLKECRAEIWTTGIVGDDSHKRLAEIRESGKLNPIVTPRIIGLDTLLQEVPVGIRPGGNFLKKISLRE